MKKRVERAYSYLRGRAKCMSKVNADNSSSLKVNHEVCQMPISNAEHVMTDAQLSVGHGELSTQSVVRLRAGTQTTIHSSTIM